MQNDLWFAWRRLANRRARSLTVIATLALGIGSALAVFGVADSALLRPLPFPDADRLVRITEKIPVPNFPELWLSDVGYQRLAADNRTLSTAAAYFVRGVSIGADGSAQRVPAARVTASLFDVLGVGPTLGRAFRHDEDVPNGPNVVVIADWVWRSILGARPDVIGQAINVDGTARTIIGVLGPTATFPSRTVGVWIPLGLTPSGESPFERRYSVVGRLRPGVTTNDAAVDLSRVTREVGMEFRGPHAGSALDAAGFQARVKLLRDEVVGAAKTTVLLLLAGVLLVLVLTCVNVVNLQLADAVARREELAVRASLGASRARLVRGALVEGVLLATAGATAGVLLALGALRFLVVLLPGAVSADAIDLFGSRVLAVAVVVALIVASAIGVIPVAIVARGDLAPSLRSRSSAGGAAGAARLRQALAAVQVAVAVMLLYGSGLMIGSARAVQGIDLGFRPDSTLSLRLNFPRVKYAQRQQREAVVRSVLERIRSLPGVEAAGVASFLPLTPERMDGAMALEGRPFRADGTDPTAEFRVVSAEYFRAMGIRLHCGRTFTDDETRPRYTPVVISRSLAREIWPEGGDPIGHRLRTGPFSEWMPIVGVVEDAKNRSLTDEPRPELYLPAIGGRVDPPLPAEVTFILRTASEAQPLVALVRRIVAEHDAELPVFEVRSVREIVRAMRTREITAMRLMMGYSVVALLLALGGSYAVLSFLVVQRRRELAVRLALGATPGQVMSLVTRQCGRMIGVGAAAGFIGALAFARLISGMLYGVGTVSAGVLSVVVVVMAAAGAVAVVQPAQRAARLDPSIVLRAEG